MAGSAILDRNFYPSVFIKLVLHQAAQQGISFQGQLTMLRILPVKGNIAEKTEREKGQHPARFQPMTP